MRKEKKFSVSYIFTLSISPDSWLPKKNLWFKVINKMVAWATFCFGLSALSININQIFLEKVTFPNTENTGHLTCLVYIPYNFYDNFASKKRLVFYREGKKKKAY